MPVEEALIRGRVLLIAPHPDDETIGAGGILHRMQDPVILHVTDGAPRNLSDANAAGCATREDYARTRRKEVLNALEVAGIPCDRAHSLDIVDQETSFAMANLVQHIAEMLREIRPASVLTVPYEGGHPDHDATAFCVHGACALITPPPKIYEHTLYHAGQTSGPAFMEVGRFLPGQDSGKVIVLTEEARTRKQRMLDCFTTQLHMLRHFPVDEERFREAPAYDFTQSPHPGRLWYENFDWGMTGEQWRRLAADALRALAIPTRL